MPTNPNAAPASFRRKPVTTTITAIQWQGDNVQDLSDFTGGRFSVAPDGSAVAWVEKFQFWATIETNDWLIAEADGTGVYPCAADVFDATYEAAQ